jgi:hypothetical protein
MQKRAIAVTMEISINYAGKPGDGKQGMQEVFFFMRF